MNSENLASSAARIESAISKADLPTVLREQITSRLTVPPFRDSYVAVRSSGTDEDSASHSFAGEKEGIACVHIFAYAYHVGVDLYVCKLYVDVKRWTSWQVKCCVLIFLLMSLVRSV